jgi:hypothetical protein
MGGKTLKDKRGKQLCTRLNKEDFIKVHNKIIEILSQYENFTFQQIQNFPEKENFGDLDLLYIYDENFGDKCDNNLEEIIRENFNPTQYTTNNKHIIFDFNCELVGIENKKFEIELIETNKDEIEFIKFILNYNDLGNILGKILNHYGFKLSRNDGLVCELRHKTIDKTKSWNTNLGEIFLSKDPKKICEFIGLDYNTYLEFANCQSSNNIYDWLISSPLFDPNHFKNCVEKTRPFYNGFLEFIINKFYTDAQYENDIQHRNIQLDSIEFFGKKEEYNTIASKYIEELNVKCERKKKFSGTDVKQFVFSKNKKFENLPNDKIVKIINSFKTFCIQDKLKKKFVFDEMWEQFIILTNIDEIIKKLDEWWNLYKNDIEQI